MKSPTATKNAIMKNILLTSFLLYTFFHLNAQLNNPDNWRYYVATEKTNCHLETNDKLWLGTNAGLIIIDKNTMERSIQNITNSKLPANPIESIQIDLDGNTWIGTYDYVMARQEGDDWIELPIPVEQNAAVDIWGPLLYDFEIASDGSFWLATNNGLWHYANETWEVYNQSHPNINSSAFWMVEEVNGEILFAGTNLYSITGTSVVNLSANTPSCSFYLFGNILSQDGKAYISDNYNFIATFENNELTIQNLSNDNSPDPSSFHISTDSDEQLHVLFTNGEKYLLEGSEWTEQENLFFDQFGESHLLDHYFHSQSNEEWLAHNNKLHKDTGNNIQTTALSHIPFLSNMDKNFAAGPDSSMYTLEKKYDLHFNQYDVSLNRFHPTEGWTNIPIPNQVDGEDIYVNPEDFNVTASGDILLPCFYHLLKYDGTNWSIVTDYPMSSAQLVSRPNSNGQYAVGNNGSVAMFNGSDWSVVTPPVIPGGPFCSSGIKSIATAPNGDLWLARDGVIFRCDSNEEWTFYQEDATSISNENIAPTIDFEEDGSVWVAADAYGILRFDGSNWAHFGEDQGTPDCAALTISPNGDIWAGIYGDLKKFNGIDWDSWDEDNSGMLGPQTIIQLTHSNDGALWINKRTEGVQAYSNNAFASAVFEESINTLEIYPNPATDYIFLESGIYESVDYQILNSIGQVIMAGISQDGMVNVTSLSAGVYFMRVEMGNDMFVGKVMKR
ncbi:MAG: hypothetical protein ACI8YQ_002162 [Polaribacter sp.]|jgi:hypothetical protein